MAVIFKGRSQLEVLNPKQKLKLLEGEIVRLLVVTDIEDQQALLLRRVIVTQVVLPIKNHPFQYFLNQAPEDLIWKVTENTTGMLVAKSVTAKEAIDASVEKLLTVTEEDYRGLLKRAIRISGGWVNGKITVFE